MITIVETSVPIPSVVQPLDLSFAVGNEADLEMHFSQASQSSEARREMRKMTDAKKVRT